MIDFSPSDLLQLARLSNAAYLHDARPAVEAIGMTYVNQIGDDGCQALLAEWGGFAVIALQGTRVLEHTSIPELWDDLDGCIVTLPDGSRVHGGFWNPLAALWPRIMPLISAGWPLLTGHSLGGVRAHLAKAFVPGAEVVSFGAPKGADDAFWSTYYDFPPNRIVYEHDFAPAWPWEGPWTQPAAINWLHGGALVEVQQRPGLCLSVPDHSIDTAYVPALAGLANGHHPGNQDTTTA